MGTKSLYERIKNLRLKEGDMELILTPPTPKERMHPCTAKVLTIMEDAGKEGVTFLNFEGKCVDYRKRISELLHKYHYNIGKEWVKVGKTRCKSYWIV